MENRLDEKLATLSFRSDPDPYIEVQAEMCPSCQDPFDVDAEQIKDIPVEMTVIGGDVATVGSIDVTVSKLCVNHKEA